MQIAQLSMKTLANDITVTHGNSSNKRIRTSPPAPALRQLKRPPQVPAIRSCKRSSH